MNVSCKIIEDILPLYHDGVCSQESRAMVDEHLMQCESCKAVLNGMMAEIEVPQKAADDKKMLEALKRTWNKRKILAGTACAAAVCGILAAVFIWLTTGCFSPFTSEEITVSNICQLQNGEILYEATVPWVDGWGAFETVLTEDGKFYLIPKRPAIVLNDDISALIMTFDPESIGTWGGIDGAGKAISAYYLGDPEDAILIWERGMELPNAGGSFQTLVEQ